MEDEEEEIFQEQREISPVESESTSMTVYKELQDPEKGIVLTSTSSQWQLDSDEEDY